MYYSKEMVSTRTSSDGGNIHPIPILDPNKIQVQHHWSEDLMI